MFTTHSRSQGAHGAILPKFLEYLLILCFERRCPKQNTADRPKSKVLAPPKIFGLATTLFTSLIFLLPEQNNCRS